MHRLFVAADLPDDVRDKVTSICHDVPGARWVPPEQLHLTLRFLGDRDDSMLAGIRRSLADVKDKPFPLAVRGVGHFPPGRHPRVLWVGLESCEPLLVLQQDIERVLVESGVPAEPRRFSPHITIARLKESVPGKVEAFEAANRLLATAPFLVTEFHLYSSTLSSRGAIHRREHTYPLGLPTAES